MALDPEQPVNLLQSRQSRSKYVSGPTTIRTAPTRLSFMLANAQSKSSGLRMSATSSVTSSFREAASSSAMPEHSHPLEQRELDSQSPDLVFLRQRSPRCSVDMRADRRIYSLNRSTLMSTTGSPPLSSDQWSTSVDSVITSPGLYILSEPEEVATACDC